MFYAIGLGLADEKDITVKGLEIVKRAERVYLEAYTAILLVDKEALVRQDPYLLSQKERKQSKSNKSDRTTIPRNQLLTAPYVVGILLWTLSHPRRPRNGRIQQ